MGFWRLSGWVKHREPPGDGFAGGDLLRRNDDGSDEFGSEDVVVFDLEFQIGGWVGEWDGEAFVPVRVLGVGNDARSGESGLGDADFDVRIAGDDIGVVVPPVAGLGRRWRLISFTRSEAVAELQSKEIHVG